MQPAKTYKFICYSKRLAAVSCLVLVFFCLGRWSLSSSSPSFPNDANPVVFYANQTGSDLRLLFYEALAKAENSIFLEMYAITDPDLVQLLYAKAMKGIPVTILTDSKASPGLRKKLPASVSLQVHKGRGLMHRKVLVVDHKTTILGSVNFTTPSLTLHDNFALALCDPLIASFFEQEHETEGLFSLRGQSIEAWKLPRRGLAAKEKILNELANAKNSIHVAMFTLTDHVLTEALIKAHQRGVRVFLALDYYTAGGSSKKSTKKLAQAGIPIRTSLGAQLLHHKWALIDNSTLIAGSTNWTKSAFAYNHDDFVIIRGLTEEQQKMMLRLWRSIEKTSPNAEVSSL